MANAIGQTSKQAPTIRPPAIPNAKANADPIRTAAGPTIKVLNISPAMRTGNA